MKIAVHLSTGETITSINFKRKVTVDDMIRYSEDLSSLLSSTTPMDRQFSLETPEGIVGFNASHITHITITED
jgi:hypothetical protein